MNATEPLVVAATHLVQALERTAIQCILVAKCAAFRMAPRTWTNASK